MSELIAKMPFAEIFEIPSISTDDEKNLKKYSNCIRIYCSQAPDVFKFQIRTFKPITESQRKKDKSRFMLAQVNLSIAELEQILEYCKSQHPNMERINTKPLEILSQSDKP